MVWVWIWAAVFIVTLLVEFFTWELVSIWFTLGSIISFILALCGVGYEIQIVVFLVVSIIAMVCARNVCKKLLSHSKEKTNLDSLIGTSHVVIKDSSENESGEIKINGVVWRFVSIDGKTIEKEDGNKFIVEKEKK